MCGDMGLSAKVGLITTALAAARRTMCVAPKRVQAFVVGPDKNRPRLVMGDSAFFQQGRHHSHQILGNGDDAVSAPLAAEQHLRVRSPQLKVVCVDASGLGDPGAGPRQEKQKRPVAPTTGRPLIGRRNEGVHFGLGEVVRHLNMRPFNGDRQNALGNAEGRRIGPACSQRS